MSTFPRIADVTAAFARNIPHADAKRPATNAWILRSGARNNAATLELCQGMGDNMCQHTNPITPILNTRQKPWLVGRFHMTYLMLCLVLGGWDYGTCMHIMMSHNYAKCT